MIILWILKYTKYYNNIYDLKICYKNGNILYSTNNKINDYVFREEKMINLLIGSKLKIYDHIFIYDIIYYYEREGIIDIFSCLSHSLFFSLWLWFLFQ